MPQEPDESACLKTPDFEATLAEAKNVIEQSFDYRKNLTRSDIKELSRHLNFGIAALDDGLIRAAWPFEGRWRVDTWVQKLIQLTFIANKFEMASTGRGQPKSYDKLPLKFESWTNEEFRTSGMRVVPGAVVRRGAYIGPDTVLMPSFVNIGAFVGRGTMIDSWATVGSCAQIGEQCHISGGAGIGGVLEPLGAVPVIIEDKVFIGARAEVAEGVRVRRGAVVGMGVFLGKSTPIIDRETGVTTFGEVPEDAVVVPGNRIDPTRPTVSTYAAIIVKYADNRTREKTALNTIVRE